MTTYSIPLTSTTSTVYYGDQWYQWPVYTYPTYQQGWQCPLCKTVWSPSISLCTCCVKPHEANSAKLLILEAGE